MVTEQGYIKRMPVSTFEAQNRATRGKAGARMKEDDGVEHFITCCDHDSILFFSDRGVAYCLKAYQIPMGSRTSRGIPIVQMLPIPHAEKITSVIPVTEFSDDEYLVMLTQSGYIKKTQLSAFSNIRTNGLIAISLVEGDQLRWVLRARSEDSVIIGTRKGMTIHFRTDQEQLRPLGRPTRGVKAMSLRNGDEFISMDILPSQVVEQVAHTAELEPVDADTDTDDAEELDAESPRNQGPWVLVITTGGLGKRVPVSEFRLQNRAGMGVRAIKFRLQDDELAALRVVSEADEFIIVTSRGIIIRQVVNAITCQSRSATGVRVQRLDGDDAIVAVALVPPANEEDDETAEDSEDGEAIALDAEAIADVVVADSAADVELADDTTDVATDETDDA